MIQLRYLLEAATFRTALILARVTPRRFLRGLGIVAGSLGYAFNRRHRNIAMENMRLAYGSEMEPAEMRRIVRKCWRHFGRITFESLAFTRMTREEAEQMTDIVGRENLERALADGKGLFYFAGHFGHWEMAAVRQGFAGIPLAVVARPLDNPRLEAMLTSLRTVSGNKIIYKRNAVREVVKQLRQGSAVAIVIDQDALQNGVFVPFFGHPASTTPTLAALALRTGRPVLPCFCVPIEGGRYRIVVEPPMQFEPSGNKEDDIRRFTADCTAVIERWVRERPELWLWMHRRWKTRPPGEEETS